MNDYDRAESESQLEAKLIKQLVDNGYKYLSDVKNETALLNNIRKHINRLNNIQLSDEQWEEICNHKIFASDYTKNKKLEIVQKSSAFDFRINGESFNIHLFDKHNLERNEVEVISQYVAKTEHNDVGNRYDVNILVNGFPLVHIELKRRGAGSDFSANRVNLAEPISQIERYQRESFSCVNTKRIFEYIQLFIVSNGTDTKYFANNFDQRGLINKEFTFFWADEKNVKITDIVDFANTFLQKNRLLSMLFKYCILKTKFSGKNGKNATSETITTLLAMKPYQVHATEKVLERVKLALTKEPQRFQMKYKSGGYIWHTTGSGKTLTSFRICSILAQLRGVSRDKDFQSIKQVIFVVDRRDLDAQTINEYNTFEDQAVIQMASTEDLKKALDNKNEHRLIVTTIQKLANVFKNDYVKYPDKTIIIFDECHRSQFGDQHKKIVNGFPEHLIFGFTGTPIFKENSASRNAITNELRISSDHQREKTTEEVFGDELHSYRLTTAILDGAVLKFNLVNAFKVEQKEEYVTQDNEVFDRMKIFGKPQRIERNVKFIIDNFHLYCKQQFNSLFAVHNVEILKKYYDEFKKQIQEQEDPKKKLKIAAIFSYKQNQAFDDTENPEEVNKLSVTDKQKLEEIIEDFNNTYNKSCTLDKFYQYNNYVAQLTKNKEIDILIVVQMYLTGFDAPTLNTLWLDKKLTYHNLFQAFSRTNRVYNSLKPSGNIVTFLGNTKDDLNDAIELFAQGGEKGNLLFGDFNQHYYATLKDDNDELSLFSWPQLVAELRKFDVKQLPSEESVQKIRNFIFIFNLIVKKRNILARFEEWKSKDTKQLLTEDEFSDYKARYISLYDNKKRLEGSAAKKADLSDFIDFDAEIVKSFNIDLEYIKKIIDEKSELSLDQRKEFGSKMLVEIEGSDAESGPRELVAEFINKWMNGIIDSKYNNNMVKLWQDELFVEDLKKFDREILKINLYKGAQFILSQIEGIKKSYSDFKFSKIIKGGISHFGKGKETYLQVFDKFERITEKYMNSGISTDINDYPELQEYK